MLCNGTVVVGQAIALPARPPRYLRVGECVEVSACLREAEHVKGREVRQHEVQDRVA